MAKRQKNAILCVSFLLLGGLLYILFRQDTYIAKTAYRLLPLLQHSLFLGTDRFLFIRCYFPDFLWALSLGCGLTALFSPRCKGEIVCGGIAFLCGSAWEILQRLHVADGTADWLDIMMYLAAWGIAVLINKKE